MKRKEEEDKLLIFFEELDKSEDKQKVINNYYHDKSLTDRVRNIVNCYYENNNFIKKKIGISKFIEIIQKFGKIKYQNDSIKFYKLIMKNTDDSAQKNTINIMMRNKKLKIKEIEHFSNRDIPIIAKKCPHCSNKLYCPITQSYTICGYNRRSGYDWKGCGNDLCFACGKKLCKNWVNDQLYNKINRFHDGKCCRKKCKKIGDNTYFISYCNCSNMYVNRYC